MASSLIGGVIRQGKVSAKNLLVFEPNADKARAMESEFGVGLAASNKSLVEASDVVVVAVKPQVLEAVLQPLKESIALTRPLLISVVAGIRADSIQNWLGANVAIIRVMPNTPALIGKGASGLFGNQHTTAAQRHFTESILNSVGTTQWVETENDIDSVTALSGSGPAYFMLFIQYLVEAAKAAGLDSAAAKSLAVQTAIGAAELVSNSDDSLQTLIDKVTSPNGTTEAALQSFKSHGLEQLVSKAFDAAKRRSEELARELG